MNLDKKLFIHPQVEFAISNNDVLVKTQFKIFRLSGDVVTSKLIPALPYLEIGISLSELAQKLSIDDMDNFIEEVIRPMSIRRWLTVDTQITTSDNHLQNSNAFSSLGTNGLEVTTYLSSKKIAVIGLSDFSLTLISNLQTYFNKVSLFLPNTTQINDIEYYSYEVTNMDSLFTSLKQYDLVIFTESKENTHFEYKINNFALTYNVKILFAKACGFNISIGPTIIPKKTGCLECLSFRQMNNSTYSKEFMAFNSGKQFGTVPSDGNSVDFNAKITLAGMVTTEAIKLMLLEKVLYKDDITLEMPGTLNSIIEFNIMTNTLNSNSFLRNPRCLACGSHLYEMPEIKPWMESYTYPMERDGSDK